MKLVNPRRLTNDWSDRRSVRGASHTTCAPFFISASYRHGYVSGAF